MGFGEFGMALLFILPTFGSLLKLIQITVCVYYIVKTALESFIFNVILHILQFSALTNNKR